MIPLGRRSAEPVTAPAVWVPRPRQGSPARTPHREERAPSINLHPQLDFASAQAREAMEFYQSVLGGELTLVTFGDSGAEGPLATLVRYGRLEAPGITLTGADAPPEMGRLRGVGHVSVSLSGGPAYVEQLRRWFTALSEGGEVRQPLEAAPWGDERGVLVDRFGVSWLVTIAGHVA